MLIILMGVISILLVPYRMGHQKGDFQLEQYDNAKYLTKRHV